ncbi:MAG TPA: hypothetical protein VGO47_08475 [Chlamydiales bacterium]|nr:hypothetical protein [Chlamydiales bacterium]
MQIASRALSLLPGANSSYFEELTDLMNYPRIGVDTNCMNNTLQLNFAAAQHNGTVLDGTQTEIPAMAVTGSLHAAQGGRFGEGHRDPDHPKSHSVAGVGSDLPSNYNPGRFGLLGPSVHWRLEQGIGFVFAGRR